MNKKEAAQYLGCSERAIERYVKNGKLCCTYEKGKTRTIAVFTQSELDKIKYQTEAIKPAYETDLEPRQNSTEGNELVVYEDEPSDISRLSAMVELLLISQQVKPTDKLVLSIDDCHQLTKFPREMIKEAIASCQLKSKKIGRSWFVTKENLQKFIDEVMS
jgi:hypothetical protein